VLRRAVSFIATSPAGEPLRPAAHKIQAEIMTAMIKNDASLSSILRRSESIVWYIGYILISYIGTTEKRKVIDK
jgi:hypothetical protein